MIQAKVNTYPISYIDAYKSLFEVISVNLGDSITYEGLKIV